MTLEPMRNHFDLHIHRVSLNVVAEARLLNVSLPPRDLRVAPERIEDVQRVHLRDCEYGIVRQLGWAIVEQKKSR
jgi:hypothetical protein